MDKRFFTIIEELKKWKNDDDAILQDGTQLICKVSHISSLNYFHKIYAPLNTLDIEKIETLLKVKLPDFLLDLLLKCNGMDLFHSNLSILGLRKKKEMKYYERYFQPSDIIVENLGRYKQNEYIKFATYKEGYDVYFKSGNENNVYIMEQKTDRIVKEYTDFYEWLSYTINKLSQYFNLSGQLIKENKLVNLYKII